MKPIVFSLMLLSLLPTLVLSESAQVLVWPQPESFYDSKSVTQSRRMIEQPVVTNTYAYPMQAVPQGQTMVPMQHYPVQRGYMPTPLQGFSNSPSGFLPPMPQNFPSSIPSFSAPTVTVPSMPSMMPSYGSMPFSPMPSMGNMPFNSGGFPSNGFGNMMPFPGGNSFSGMPFGFGY